jgi:hypothetical protein
VEEEHLGIGGAIMLECVGEVEYECVLWMSGIQDTLKWWDFVNMVINSEVLTAMLLKIEGFAVVLAHQQRVFNLYWIFCLHKLLIVEGRSSTRSPFVTLLSRRTQSGR